MSGKKTIEIDYTKKYGRLSPIEEARYYYGENNYKSDRGLVCKCDCGKTVTVKLRDVAAGNTKSCKCYRHEMSATSRTEHGHCVGQYKHGVMNPTYLAWVQLKQSALNPNAQRCKIMPGIKDSWHQFEEFLDDMGEKPDGMILSRKDLTGPFDEKNCEWITNAEAHKKRWSPKRIRQEELVQRTGLTHQTILSRQLAGWSEEEILKVKKHQKLNDVRNPIENHLGEAAKFPERNDQIKYLRQQGCSLQVIGDAFGLTRERIRQIANM